MLGTTYIAGVENFVGYREHSLVAYTFNPSDLQRSIHPCEASCLVFDYPPWLSPPSYPLSPPLLAQVPGLAKPSLIPPSHQLKAQQNQIVQSMTAAQVQQYLTTVQPTLAKLRNLAATYSSSTKLPPWQDLLNGTAKITSGQNSSVVSSTFNFVTPNGTGAVISPSQSATTGQPMQKIGCGICGQPPGFRQTDADQDGLPDWLESTVADSFTPYYESSAGERDQFATFGNYVPMTVTSLVGTQPPFSYYHVAPLGLMTRQTGEQIFALRIDYMTLWNADGGLVGGGGACYYSYVGLDAVIQQLSGHELDAERSVMLVGAPPVNGGLNPDPTAYKLYILYTAAHEGTFFDQSNYGYFSQGVAEGNHVELALSLSKHSTYNFNPDFYPITPQAYIDAYNLSFSTLYANGDITYADYLLSISLGDGVFYGCLVERFTGQPGASANVRVNVGEPAHPINGSAFIDDDSARAFYLRDKLTNPVF